MRLAMRMIAALALSESPSQCRSRVNKKPLNSISSPNPAENIANRAKEREAETLPSRYSKTGFEGSAPSNGIMMDLKTSLRPMPTATPVTTTQAIFSGLTSPNSRNLFLSCLFHKSQSRTPSGGTHAPTVMMTNVLVTCPAALESSQSLMLLIGLK